MKDEKMKIKLILFFFLIASSLCHGKATNDTVTRLGGLAKISGKGYVSVIDCRTKPDERDFLNGHQYISSLFSICISNFTAKTFDLKIAKDQLNLTGGNVAVFIVDDPFLPIALSAPEEKWAMLNVSPLSFDKPTNEILRRRLSILFIRQCCRVLGSDESPGFDTSFHSIFNAKDIDKITSFDITMGAEMNIPETMKLRGIEKNEFGTYEEACMLGIAHRPTNNIQKAIWDKVHAAPKNPMKIEFDPKKGR